MIRFYRGTSTGYFALVVISYLATKARYVYAITVGGPAGDKMRKVAQTLTEQHGPRTL